MPYIPHRLRVSVRSVLSRVLLTSRMMGLPPMTMTRTRTTSLYPLTSLHPLLQQTPWARLNHQLHLRSPPAGLPNSSPGNGFNPPAVICFSLIPPRPLLPRRTPLQRKAEKRRNADPEGPGRLVNTASIRKMTSWVSSCWRSRVLMISLNSATVRTLAITTFPVDL